MISSHCFVYLLTFFVEILLSVFINDFNSKQIRTPQKIRGIRGIRGRKHWKTKNALKTRLKVSLKNQEPVFLEKLESLESNH